MIYNLDGSHAIPKILEQIYNNAPVVIGSDGHDLPQNRGQLLSYKRAMQLKSLPWTALETIPTYSSATGCAAGSHTGVIYSSAKEYDKFVGYEVSIRTFMTAVHNPYSLLYTEDILGTRSKSAYGITYHGINCGAYFGVVCNIFVAYTIGWAIPWNTAEFASLAANDATGELVKAADQTALGLRLFDVIWEPGHGNVIIDIVRDSSGNPTTIYWAESVHDYPKINQYTLAQAQNRMDTNGAIIYRPTGLYAALNYTPSPFVAVGNETAQTYTYNDDICTYAGDYASFYQGEAVHINYAKGSYTSMQLYKGSSLIATISLPASYNDTHSVEITSRLSGPGKYKARLTNGSSNSDYTYFEIIEATVTASLSNKGNKTLLTVNFESANGVPKYVQLTYRNGSPRGTYPLSQKEIETGSCTFDPLSLSASQSYDGYTEPVYVKVFFAGDYGVVRNDFVDTGLS